MEERRQRQPPGRPGRSSSALPLLVAALAAFGALLGWLFSQYGDRIDWSSDGPRLVFFAVLLAGLIAGFGFAGIQLRSALGSALAWIAVGLVLVAGYSYRSELSAVWQRIGGELDPSRPQSGEEPERFGARTLTIRQSANGHFHVDTRINGTEVRLLVDTGASLTVLNRRQAERAGIFVSDADFTVEVRTGSGYARAAQARIDEMELGDARLSGVPALIMNTPGDLSVLGINTLQRFRSYEVRDGVLTITW